MGQRGLSTGCYELGVWLTVTDKSAMYPQPHRTSVVWMMMVGAKDRCACTWEQSQGHFRPHYVPSPPQVLQSFTQLQFAYRSQAFPQTAPFLRCCPILCVS